MVAVQPWTFLPIEAFIVIQMSTLGTLVITKIVQACCCSSNESTNLFFTCLTFFLAVVYVDATVCGFLHPDISFNIVSVEIEKAKEDAAVD